MTSDSSHHFFSRLSRVFAYLMVSGVFLYLINNYLVYWQGWPGPYQLFLHLGWLAGGAEEVLSEAALTRGWIQLAAYLVILGASALYAFSSYYQSLAAESIKFEVLAAYLVRAAFWCVVLIGFVDMLISYLRIENYLQFWVGDELLGQLARPAFRGTYVHYPLMGLALIMALILRKISFSWLALLVVLAEFQIVLSRFVFSYEQAFMGDLVRFWYAALFLFASAYTLVHEGHVRVDVLYAGFSRVKKAWTNIFGSLLLGMPLCWVILMQGMGGKGNSINSPLLNFEISQSGYGMYVKYVMAGFLLVFAVTMIIQFSAYLLSNVAQLIESAESEFDQDTLPARDAVST